MIRYVSNKLIIRKCKNIIKKNSLTFYKAFSKIKNSKIRNGVYIVYAFCRYADDLIDENKDVKGLLDLKEDLKNHAKGLKINKPIFRALNLIKDRYPKEYDYQPYFDMIEGQFMDVNRFEYENMEQLLKYCYFVASSVGFMLLPILEPENHEKLHNFAKELGYAMQITNILRDVGEDFNKGRIYLPKNLLKKFKVDLEYEMSNGPSKEFKLLFDYLEEEARNYYSNSLKEINYFNNKVKLPLYYAAILYRGILDKIKENKYDVFNKRNFLNDSEKTELILRFKKHIK